MTDFVDGFIAKKPHENAPDFIKAKVSIRCEEFLKWMREHHKGGWVNIEIKESRGGKFYAQADSFEPQSQPENPTPPEGGQGAGNPPDFDEDIPF